MRINKKIISVVIIVLITLIGFSIYNYIFGYKNYSSEKYKYDYTDYSGEFVEYSPNLDSTAIIEVYATDIAEKPISEYIFGKFLEHHGSREYTGCIYHGIWAQILDNPGFERSRFFGINIPEESIAYRWEKYGSGEVTYSLSASGVGRGTSQLTRVKTLSSPRVGIKQTIYMPLHRETEYQLSLWIKGEASHLIITVESFLGDILAQAIIDKISLEWTKHTVNFTVTLREAIPHGKR